MAIRRIAVEDAFITPDVLDGWKAVLAVKNVETGFAKLDGSLLEMVAPYLDYGLYFATSAGSSTKATPFACST